MQNVLKIPLDLLDEFPSFPYLTPEKEWRTSAQSVPAPGVKQYAVPDESVLQMSMESLMRGIGTNDGITD